MAYQPTDLEVSIIWGFLGKFPDTVHDKALINAENIKIYGNGNLKSYS